MIQDPCVYRVANDTVTLGYMKIYKTKKNYLQILKKLIWSGDEFHTMNSTFIYPLDCTI